MISFNPNRPVRSVGDMTLVLKEFKRTVKAKTLEEIERKDITAYRDSCLARGLAGKTVEKKLAYLCALYNVAFDSGKVKYNPAANIRVPKDNRRRRKPFDMDDLKAIFTSAPFTKGRSLGRKTGEAGVWLPLLALYQGCRLEELAQLLVTDVQCVDGVHLLDINDDEYIDKNRTQGKKILKNPASRRRLPLHPAVIGAGFLDYVEQVRKRRDVRLFQALQAGTDGKFHTAFGKAFSGLLRKELNITDPSKVFHSFRHTFRTACREAGIDEEMADALMGHSATQHMGRRYGQGFSLQRLSEAVNKIEYPGLVIRRLVSPQA